MGIAEGILALLLMLGGGYAWGYTDKECPMAKRINFQIPPEQKEQHYVIDCLERSKSDIGECNDKVSTPRYLVSESEYFDLKIYVGEKSLYLDTCDSQIKAYNKDPYVDD